MLKIESEKLLFTLEENVAVGNPFSAINQVPHAVDPLKDGGDALKPEGDLTRNRLQFQPARGLKKGELGYLDSIHPDLPAQSRGPQGRRLPIIFLIPLKDWSRPAILSIAFNLQSRRSFW